MAGSKPIRGSHSGSQHGRQQSHPAKRSNSNTSVSLPSKPKKPKNAKQPQHQPPSQQSRPSQPPSRSQHPLPNRVRPFDGVDRKRREPDVFTFGSRDNYRPPRASESSLPTRPDGAKMQFNFNAVPAGPRFANAASDGRQSYRRPRDNNRGRRPYGRNAPHDRPIIRALNGRATTPERLPGMADGNIQFRSLDELSESMSESDSDESHAISSKRRRVDDIGTEQKPSWSNPDPYTSLPPVFEPDRKKTDVVQFIRKAKVIQSQESTANAIADNVDFVSLAFSDEEDDEAHVPSIQSRINANANRVDALPRRPNVLEEAELAIPLPPRPELPDMPIPMSSGSRKRKPQRLGGITTSWATGGSLATPWKPSSYAYSTDMTWRLHEEILDFHGWVRPVSCEDRIREHLITRIEDVLCRSFRDCRVRAFGSFASGLYLPTGDMDLVLVSREYERSGRPAMNISKSQMRHALNDLIRADIARAVGSQIIATAKVPIIKFVDKSSDLKVDISFENLSGVVANGTYSSWKAEFPDLPLLVSIIKQFLLMRDLNEVFNGGLGGFSITCMVVSFLQMETKPQGDSTLPVRNLGQSLIDLLDFYGKKFNMKSTQISFKPVGHFPKTVKFVGRHKRPEIGREKWCIIDPNNPDNDISAGTTMAPLIASTFSEAADTLRATMRVLSALPSGQQEHHSILGSILGGNYESFRVQRERMDQLDQYYLSHR